MGVRCAWDESAIFGTDTGRATLAELRSTYYVGATLAELRSAYYVGANFAELRSACYIGRTICYRLRSVRRAATVLWNASRWDVTRAPKAFVNFVASMTKGLANW